MFFRFGFVLLSSITIFLVACRKDKVPVLTSVGYEEGEEYLAGDLSRFDGSELAFSFEWNGLNGSDGLDFFVGNSFFQDNWVGAPSSTTARDGLGPLFNAPSCAACHFKDGRGMPLNRKGLVIRFSIPGMDEFGGPLGDLTYGTQLQNQSIPGANSEVDINVDYTELVYTYPDGTKVMLRKPNYSFTNWRFGAPGSGWMFSPRIGQQVIGMGILEAIAESEIQNNVDETDSDGDGISGRINHVWNPITQKIEVGRLGWKANVPSVEVQVFSALNHDIGITTSRLPEQNHTVKQSELDVFPNGGDPELSDENLKKLVLYTRVLAVPVRRDARNEEVIAGKKLFNDLGCVKCHKPTMKTDNHSDLTLARNKTVHPYTDLLLHNMGEGLADGRPDFEASGTEWRTPPLWGIGLLGTVNGTGQQFLLHDGRARNVEEAILWHGGEAAAIKLKFTQLSAADRKKVIRFINSL